MARIIDHVSEHDFSKAYISSYIETTSFSNDKILVRTHNRYFYGEISILINLSLRMRKPTTLVSDQVGHKPAYTVKEAG